MGARSRRTRPAKTRTTCTRPAGTAYVRVSGHDRERRTPRIPVRAARVLDVGLLSDLLQAAPARVTAGDPRAPGDLVGGLRHAAVDRDAQLAVPRPDPAQCAAVRRDRGGRRADRDQLGYLHLRRE